MEKSELRKKNEAIQYQVPNEQYQLRALIMPKEKDVCELELLEKARFDLI